MTNAMRDYLQSLKLSRAKRHRAGVVLVVLSLIVAAGVSWQLHLTGITMTGDAYCGYEEHEHSADCYEKQLVCGQEESEEHTHTDACYQATLVCQKPEHVHTLACYSDSSADVETSGDWTAAIPGNLTGNWGEDVAAVAKSQIGYTESTKNYQVGDDGVTKNGYTRYGAWYGNDYGKWDGMFASFCIHYAGIEKSSFPYAAGAQSWITQLKSAGLYSTNAAQIGVGDLVFYQDTMGIVTAVNGSSLTVVSGDVDGKVAQQTISAGSVTGIGLIPENPAQKAAETDEAEKTAETAAAAEAAADETAAKAAAKKTTGTDSAADTEMTDYAARVTALLAASDEEFVTLWQGYESANDAEAFEAYIDSLETEDEETYLALTARVDKLINSQVETLEETTPVSLADYLAEESHKGTITMLLMDENGNELTKNASGNYEVLTGQTYKLKYDVSAPSGVAPGTYTAQLPTGITYTASSGNKITTSTGTEIGTWSIDSTGKITFNFNENARNAQNLRFTFTTDVAFAEANKTLDFDGSVKVEVKQPGSGETTQTYNVSKYKTSINGNTIQWEASVVGDGEHTIVGSTVKDTLSGTNQTIEKQNITIVIWENEYYSGKDAKKYRHQFTISQNDPNLTWTTDTSGKITGWKYTIPQTLTGCTEGHDEGYKHTDTDKTYTVKNTDTIYFRYSTGIVEGSDGPYTNSFTHGEKTASYTTDTPRLGVVKRGGLDEDAGVYKWHLELSVPNASSRALLNVVLLDRMNVLDTAGNWVTSLNMNLDNMKSATVTATVRKENGTTETVTVPKYTDSAASTAQYVYRTTFWDSKSSNGVYYYVEFYKRCTCTQDHCAKWDSNKCGSDKLGDFCRCFNGDAVTFKVDMEQDAAEALAYQGLGYTTENYAWVQRHVVQPDGTTKNVTDDEAHVKENIPGVFTKENIAKPSAGNSWMASFQITVNEGKADLSGMENGVTIEDQMSTTLVFNPASLKITATDKNGTVTTLTQGTDYTVGYDADAHKASIHIPKPGACQYTLDYSAAISVGENDKTAYSNKASVTLLGHTYEDEVTEVQLSNWAASADTYSVSLYKMAADKTIATSTGGTAKAPLAGATFGLFNADGVQLASGTTDANGSLTFETDTVAGLIFYPDTAYYLQETKSPDGYNMDTTKAWFYFSSGDESKAPTVEGATFTKIEGKKTKTGTEAPFQFTNTTGYTLPSTGGPGTLPYVLIGLSLMTAAAVVYGYGRRRHGRRVER